MAILGGTPAPSPSPSAAVDTAVIRQSASTNRAGFSIAVPRTGEAMLVVGDAQRSVPVDPALAAKLYADLGRAGDLDALVVEHCMKSASFGSTTVIAFHGKASPDLQCAADAVGQALNADAEAIAQAAFPEPRRKTMPVFRATPSPI
jgi:hypothetical protein